MGHATNKRRNVLFVGLAMLLSLALAAASLEALLRAIPIPAIEVHRREPFRQEGHRTFFTYDAELGWRGRPDAAGLFAGWEFDTQVHLNELGFRDVRPWRDKLPGQYELLLLGDSITWGYGVEEGRRYSDRLSDELSKLGVDVVVRNAAVSGYDTGQELLLYRQLRRRGCPDVVLIGLYGNDVTENLSAWQGVYPKPYFQLAQNTLQLKNVPVPTADRWSVHQALTDRGWMSRLREHSRLYAMAAWIKETARQAVQADSPTGSPSNEAGIEVTAALLRELVGEVLQDKRDAAVLVLPDVGVLTDTRVSASTLSAQRAQVPSMLELSQLFQEAKRNEGLPLFYRLDGAHWTERAHELGAQQIARFLAESAFFHRAPRQCSAQS